MTLFRSHRPIPGLYRELTTLVLLRIRGLLWCVLSLIMTSPSAAAADDGQGRSIPITVLVDTVREEQVGGTISGTGNVAAWREMSIGSEAGGLAISEIHVDEGDRVAKGQTVRTLGSALDLEALRQQRLILRGGRTVLLAELGAVERSWAEPRRRVRFDDREVVDFSIYRSQGSSEVRVAEAARERVAAVAAAHADVTIREVMSSTEDVLEGYERHSAEQSRLRGPDP